MIDRKGISKLLVSCCLSLWSCQPELFDEQNDQSIRLLGTSFQEKALDILASENGALYILGTTTSVNNQNDLFLSTLSPAGKEKNLFVWGDSLWADGGAQFIEHKEKLMVVCTESVSATDTDINLLEFNNSGELILRFDVPDQPRSEISSIAVSLTDGSTISIGTTDLEQDGRISIGLFLFKTDPSNKLEWPGGRYYQVQGQQLTAVDAILYPNENTGEDEILVLAQTSQEQAGATGKNCLLLRVDRNGIVIGSSIWGTGENDSPIAILVGSSGKIFVVKTTNEVTPNHTLDQINSRLEIEESFEINSTSVIQQIHSMVACPDGNFLLATSVLTPETSLDMGILLIDQKGSVHLEQSFGFDQEESGVKAIPVETEDSYDIYLIGNVDFGNDNTMIGLIKTNSHANTQ